MRQAANPVAFSWYLILENDCDDPKFYWRVWNLQEEHVRGQGSDSFTKSSVIAQPSSEASDAILS